MAPMAFCGKRKAVVERSRRATFKQRALAVLRRRSAPLAAAYWTAGVGGTYATCLVCVATSAFDTSGSGVVAGIVLCLAALLVFGVGSLFLEFDICTYLGKGIGTSLLPAALAGSYLILHDQYNGISRIEVDTLQPRPLLMLRLDPAEIEEQKAEAARQRRKYTEPNVLSLFSLSDPIPRLVDADVVTGTGWTSRPEYVGGVQVTLPRPSDTAKPRGYRFAGKDESGTFCAMPLVHANWTADEEPVHLWAVCDNEWQGEVNCTAAMLGHYNQSDWWGHAPLRNCFDRTARALEASAVKGAVPTLAHGRRPAMLQFDSGRDEDFRSAVREAAAVHGLLAPSGDAAFMLVSEEECCARETVLQGALTASIIVIALVPLVVFIGRTVVGDARRLLRRKMAGLAFTRTKLRAIVSESLEL